MAARKAAKTMRRAKESPPLSGDVRESVRVLLEQAAALLGALPGGEPAPVTCCAEVCDATPAGKMYVVVCDGKTMKALKGTADGQYLAWDHTAGTWVLASV